MNNELVCYKIFDLIGDLFLFVEFGMSGVLVGYVIVYKVGYKLYVKFIKVFVKVCKE